MNLVLEKCRSVRAGPGSKPGLGDGAKGGRDRLSGGPAVGPDQIEPGLEVADQIPALVHLKRELRVADAYG